MTLVVFSETLENGTTGDAVEVTTMLDELKNGANAINDENIGPQGISESKIAFSTTGHTHDGTDSTLVALAANNTTRGSVKIRRVVAGCTIGSFSANLNAAGQTQIDNVMGVRVLIRTDGSGDGHSFHTGAGLPGTVTVLNSYTSRYEGGSAATTFWWYSVVNTATTPNEVFVFVGSLSGIDPTQILVMLIGV